MNDLGFSAGVNKFLRQAEKAQNTLTAVVLWG
jgi:hypothetical protein